MKRTATRHIARVRAAIAEMQASDLAHRRASSISSRARRSTSSARRPRCSRRSTAATRSRGSRRRTGAASTRWSRRRPTSRRSRDCRRTSRWPARAPTPRRRRPSSTTSRRSRTSPSRLAEGADWFRDVGTDESPGHGALHGERVRDARRRRRVHDGHATARDHRDARRRNPARSHDPRRAAGRSRRDHHGRPARHAGELGGHAGDRLRARCGRVHRARRRHRHRRGRRERVAIPRGRVVRPVHAVQAGQPADHRRAHAHRDVGRDRRRTSTSCAGGSTRSRSAPAARWPRRSRW